MSQGQNDLVANVQLAIEHHKNGNIEEAILQYEKVLPKLAGKTKASLSGNVGALYMSKGEYELAKGHFLAAVDADPDNSSAQFNLAVVLTTKLGEHMRAIKHCGNGPLDAASKPFAGDRSVRVETIAHVLAGLEVRHALARNLDRRAGADLEIVA